MSFFWYFEGKFNNILYFLLYYFWLFLSQLEIIKLKIFCLFIHSGKQQKSCLDLKFCDSDIESDWYSVILLQIDISYYFDVFFTVSWFIINEWKLSARPAPTTAHHSSIRRVWQEWLQWRRVRQSYCPGSHQPCLSWAWLVVLEAGPGFSYDYNYILLNIANKRWQW